MTVYFNDGTPLAAPPPPPEPVAMAATKATPCRVA